ncbi:MAG: AmpG family muropeptide MFS transporter [Gammaproteobacteria bacterium CG22_combo_CG10-13_8_21_14_all_40_8]|nr:MAG: AmpG family muropeptide MFS transporter [Gammaproteobacteria bacterium CG22_combo_CG10-13_8_21_14_all_40_8]
MLASILTGFFSGLPLYLLFQLIPAWLRFEGIDLATIGLFNLIQLPYVWKFLWSPLADRVSPKRFGRRKTTLIPVQILLTLSISAFALLDAKVDIYLIAGLSFIVAFYSATQDIVIEAYRRELLEADELGMGNSLAVNGYRISSLVPGSLALILADAWPWSWVLLSVSFVMGLGILVTLWLPQSEVEPKPPKTLKEAVIEPLHDFFSKIGIKPALITLLFIFLYKLGDNMAVSLAQPFYIDMGFSKIEIGTVAKFSALWSSIAGGLLGGLVMLKVGVNRSLWLFGVVQMASILGYVQLTKVGANPEIVTWLADYFSLHVTSGELWLFGVVSFEYIGVGLGTVALVSYIFLQTNKSLAATQIALLTSFSTIPRVVVGSSTGFLVDSMGWVNFYYLCFFLAIPGMLLLIKAAPWNTEPK